MRAYLFVAMLLLVIFGSIGGYLYARFSAFSKMDFTPPPVTIAAGVARAERWDQHLQAVGSIKAVRGVDLTSETSGEVTAIEFVSGQQVEAGQLLVVLNDEVEQASRRSQIASLDLAKILFERDQKLVQQKSIPQSQYDRSKADLESARAQLAETEARIKNKHIDAPFTGTLGILQVDVGDYVSPGTVIAALQDLDELEIDFTLPARFAPLLRPGLAIELQVGAFPEKVFSATLSALDSRVDPDTLNLLARARIHDSGGLLPGMFASLRIALGTADEVLTVPETAITYSLQGSTVYVIREDSSGQLTVDAVVVQVGEVRDGRVGILRGLEAGQQIVTAGQNKLFRGASVRIDATVQL
ncbi:MAG: efflux RND transporter periplasmic adaptor subunit [Gammaproteobacteria bacterium]|nr:efflux RND transporter periplasmic adaptor subunit [Gammaproteobacteria bacterium]